MLKTSFKKRIRYDFTFLFIAMTVLHLTSILLEHNLLEAGILSLFYFLLLFIAIFSIRTKPKIVYLALCLFIPNTAVGIAILIFPPNTYLNSIYFFSASFLALLIACTIIYIVIKKETIEIETIMGGLCGYLLLSEFWTRLYVGIELLQPGSFNFSIHGVSRGIVHLYDILHYYSQVTLVGTGCGDITPMTHCTRSLSSLEGLTGMFYMVFFISWLVGMHISLTILKKTKK